MFERIQQIARRVRLFVTHDLWSVEAGGLPTFRAFFLWVSRVLFIAIRGFQRDRCMFHASALTYITALSLVPVLAFMFAMAKGLGAYDVLIERVISPGLETLFPAAETAAGEVAAGGESATSSLRGSITQILDFVASTDASKLGLFGLAVLLWAVVKMLGSVEKSFNEIWGISASRTAVRKVSDYLAIVVIAPILMLTATAITASSQSAWAITYLSENLHLGPLLDFLIGALPIVVVWIGFTFIYMCLPNKRMRFVSALVGGVGGGTLWHLLMIAFLSVASFTTNFNALYAGFAAIPILLVWICFSWVTVLFGAELAAAYQKAPTYRGSAYTGPLEKALEEVIALRALTLIAANFLRGDKAWSVESLSERMHIPELWIDEVIGHLVGGEILIRLGDEGNDGVQPARALEAIHVADVLLVLRGNRQSDRFPPRGKGDERLDQLLSELEKDLRISVHNHSLRELAEEALRDGEQASESMAAQILTT